MKLALILASFSVLSACRSDGSVSVLDPVDNGTTTTASSTQSSVTTDTGSVPYVYGTEESVEPTLNSAEIEEAITNGLATIISLDPMDLHESYEVFRNLGDSYCPYYYEDYWDEYEHRYWYDSCTTTAGVVFDGYGYSYEFDGGEDASYAYPEDRYFSGATRIVDVDGNSWEGSGYSSYYQQVSSGPTSSSYWSSYGVFERKGSFSDENWLDKGYSYEIYHYLSYYGVYPGVTLSLNGNISGIDGMAGTVVVDELYIYSETLGSPCPQEIYGTVSVRSDSGQWFEVTFDGPPYWGGAAFPAACDGCGDVYFDGSPIGSVCPDFSQLTDWVMQPW